jgi:DNA-binding transcriptional LysR family regulator
MARAVRAGMGVGMLLTLLGDADDQLVRIGKPDPQLDTSLWILTHADLKHVSRIRLFTDFMHGRLRLTEAIVTARRIQKE